MFLAIMFDVVVVAEDALDGLLSDISLIEVLLSNTFGFRLSASFFEDYDDPTLYYGVA